MARSYARRARGDPDKAIAAKTAFIREMRKRSSVIHSAEVAGYGPDWFYDRRKIDDDFRKQWDDAIAYTTEKLEDSLYERGTRGDRKAVWYQGRIVGYEYEKSDAAAIFLLKGRKPETYRERIEHLGGAGSQLVINVAINRLEVSDLRTLVAIMEKVIEKPKTPEEQKAIDVMPTKKTG